MENINIGLRKTCRTCAENFSKNLSPLFKEENLLLFSFEYNEKHNIKISKNDGLPQNICSECFDELMRIKKFLIKCEESEQFLIQKLFKQESSNKSLNFETKNVFKSEYSSDNDQNIEEYYCNIDIGVTNSTDLKTTELIIEKLDPTAVEIKIENIVPSENSNRSSYEFDNEQNCIYHFEDQIFTESNSESNCKSEDPKNKINFKRKFIKQKKNELKCRICDDIFKNVIDFKNHNKLHHEIKKNMRQTLLCDLCGKEFAKPESLKDHMNIHSGIKPYKCEICDKAFSVKNALRSHILKHSKKQTFACEICGKVFNTKSYYNEHYKRHEKGILLENNEKPFKCPHCPKSFKLLSTLTAHCNYHNKTSDRKYHCEECNTTFKRSDHLKEHINGVHLKILPFKCDICFKSFVTGAIRNAHVRKFHSGIRHKCNLCDKDFSLSASLSRHKRSHNGDKRFICEVCNMSFMAVYQIEKHMETHKIDETTKNNLISQTYQEIAKAVIDINDR